MSYLSLLEREGIASQYLVIMKPRRQISDAWTNVTGNIYSKSFDLGQIVDVSEEGDALNEAASASVGSGEWFYDVDAATLYVNVGADPISSQIVVTYEIYFGTFDAHWYRDPLDDTSREVYYEPLVVRSPQVTNSTSEIISGFLPTFSASITISNATQFLQEHVYESSFHFADILLYHYLDELDVDNIKLVLKGYCREISATDADINFSLLDATAFFDKQYRNPVGPSFFAQSMFSGLDMNYQGRPLRQVFGVVDGFIPVNIDFLQDGGNTDNRTWICLADHNNLGTVSTTVLASPSSTTTRTYLTSVNGFRVGDTFWNKTVTSKYGIITAVGANYIEHAALGSANASGNDIERSFVGNIKIRKNDTVYTCIYGRDYTEYIDSTNKVAGFTFVNNFESGFLSDTLSTSDIVSCRVYGHKLSETLGGGAFGSNSATTGNTTNGVVILYHLLKTCLGLTEAELNTTSFSSVASSATDQIGFAIPGNTGEDFPTYKDLILQICQTILGKFLLDFDGLWKLAVTGPLGAVTKIIEDDEILKGDFSYNFSYSEIISRVLVEYASRQVSDIGDSSGGAASVVTSESDIAKNLHLVERQQTFKSFHFLESEAQTLANRLKYYFGDRKGTCKIATKNRFFNTELDDVIRISRARMPGFSYDEETNRDRDFVVTATQKSLSEISIDLNDQKGIEDNEGDW